jgi:Leukotriene A4 hydrolase, C-terminal
MPEKAPAEKLAGLDKRFGLATRGHFEIAHNWVSIAIRNDHVVAMDRMKTYLTTIGRSKLVLPWYMALLATPRVAARPRRSAPRPGRAITRSRSSRSTGCRMGRSDRSRRIKRS